MLAATDPLVHTVTVLACTQLLKTELVNNIAGYYIDLDPSPIIVLQPTEKMAKAWSQDRLDKMIRDTPVLAEKFGLKKARESSNTILHKEFAGGHVTMVGANAPSDLASRPVRIVLCDETDKYPASAGKEGDPINLISERSATFWNSKKVHVCSPTIEGRSRIQFEYDAGDQRIYEVPCPHCNVRQELKWANVHWDKNRPETAQYYCEHCGEAWTEAERLRGIQKGEWRATAPFKGHASFRCNKLVSPWESLGVLAEKFVKAKESPEKLKVFVNTQLAETWKEKGDAPEWERIYERRERYKIGTVPKGVVFLTAGVDVQENRLEVEVVGWGEDKQSWSIQTYVYEGNTAAEGDHVPGEVWKKLDELMNDTWESENGTPLGIRTMAVDSGYRTQIVYNWCRKYPITRVIAVKGKDSQAVLMNSGNFIDIRGKQRIARAAKVFTIGTSVAKQELYGWLRLPVPTQEGEDYPPGYCHFPEYGEEFFKQLVSEQQIKRMKDGYAVYHWEKTQERNEALDCRVYARAAASYFGMDRFRDQHWKKLKESAAEKLPKTLEKAPTNPKIRRRPSQFL